MKFKDPHAPGRRLAWIVDQRMEVLVVLMLSMHKAPGLMSNCQNPEKGWGMGGEEVKRIKRRKKCQLVEHCVSQFRNAT